MHGLQYSLYGLLQIKHPALFTGLIHRHLLERGNQIGGARQRAIHDIAGLARILHMRFQRRAFQPAIGRQFALQLAHRQFRRLDRHHG